MGQNTRDQKNEKQKPENTGNQNELKVGKNDSPDYNGVGSNEENIADAEGTSKASKTTGERGTNDVKAWKNYTDEPISGATEA